MPVCLASAGRAQGTVVTARGIPCRRTARGCPTQYTAEHPEPPCSRSPPRARGLAGSVSSTVHSRVGTHCVALRGWGRRAHRRRRRRVCSAAPLRGRASLGSLSKARVALFLSSLFPQNAPLPRRLGLSKRRIALQHNRFLTAASTGLPIRVVPPRSENLLSKKIWGISGTFCGIRSLFHISAKKKAS
jgi:hypothetical protein